ncbi:MAG TPA: zinc ribbon domain-containing protein [Candidatus Sulfomarinibacteraceae bacterium]|nr:zinc ribbon domain-containing protein [Candidatus Sulfomarinibacteraceae bacterium]
MTNELLQQVACPNCQNPIDVREHGRHVTCDACRSRFILNGRLCPYCSTYQAEDELFCRNCGNALTRVCRNCNTSNWAGDEYCAKCGQPMDIFDLLVHHHTNARRELLEKRWEQIRQIRTEEALAAEKRAARFQKLEEQRQAELKMRLAQQQREEKRLLLLALAAIAFFVLMMIVYTAITLLGS